MAVFRVEKNSGYTVMSNHHPVSYTHLGKVHERIYRPATHPIHFAVDSPDKIHRCAAWAVFFFSEKHRTLKIS